MECVCLLCSSAHLSGAEDNKQVTVFFVDGHILEHSDRGWLLAGDCGGLVGVQ